MKFSVFNVTGWGAISLAGLIACSDAKQATTERELASPEKVSAFAAQDPRPAPGTEDSIEAQLKRYKGQNKFLTAAQTWGRAGGAGPVSPQAARTGETQSDRKIQESDIFKVGPEGSKLLYLLNNYRGLQVISFAKGPEAGELLGRVSATGNYPQDMFYDAGKNRIVVLENSYGDAYSQNQSRVVVYDVSDAAHPRIAKTLDLEGSLSENRMVGDVLYVATTVRPNYNERQTAANAFVHSFDLSAQDVVQVDKEALSAGFAWGTNMNSMKVEENGQTKYYLTAVLSKDAWGWRGDSSLVELVDISDPKGDVRSVMVVNAKGSVTKRSQVQVKGGALIVVSNYTSGAAAAPATGGTVPPPPSAQDPRRLRIAVESFALPTQNAEVLDESEAEYRELHFKRELAKVERELKGRILNTEAFDAALDQAKRELQANPDVGLKGRFVKKGKTLVKVIPEGYVSVGNTQNLNAVLQDVRVDGDTLYAFWVPANFIDPLDIFDISKPSEGVTHKAHLEFDGWVQHAIPLSHEGRSYIVGLGWVIPSVNNEQRRRYPQAALFEIRNFEDGSTRAELITTKRIGDANTWVDFGAQDKFFEMRMADAGRGSIMFQVSSYADGRYLQGAKLVDFDLSVAQRAPSKVFNEGKLLAGDRGWLRRVFTNAEIDRIQAFSDEALATFPSAGDVSTAVVEAANVLELARNIRGYVTLKAGDARYGVQVVNRQTYGQDPSVTELRLVKENEADAELNAILSKATVQGDVVKTLRLRDDAVAVFSQRYTQFRLANGRYESTQHFFFSVFAVVDGKFAELSATSWTKLNVPSQVPASAPTFVPDYSPYISHLSDGTVLVLAGGEVKTFQLQDAAVSVQALSLSPQCLTESSPNTSSELIDLNGKLFRQRTLTVLDPARRGLSYNRTLLSSVTKNGNTLECGAEVNIPGRALALLGDGRLVTNDTRLLDIVTSGEGERQYHSAITEPALSALKFEDVATLADIYDVQGNAYQQYRMLGSDKLVFLTNDGTSPGVGFPSGRVTAPGIGTSNSIGVPRPSPFQQAQRARLVTLSLDADLSFIRTVHAVELPGASGSAVLSKVIGDVDGTNLLVLASGRRVAVFGYDGVNRPVAKKLALVDGAKLEAPELAPVLPGYGWQESYVDGLNFEPSTKIFTLVFGQVGVRQLKLVD